MSNQKGNIKEIGIKIWNQYLLHLKIKEIDSHSHKFIHHKSDQFVLNIKTVHSLFPLLYQSNPTTIEESIPLCSFYNIQT